MTAEIIGLVDAIKLDWGQVTDIYQREIQKEAKREWTKEYKKDLKKRGIKN